MRLMGCRKVFEGTPTEGKTARNRSFACAATALVERFGIATGRPKLPTALPSTTRSLNRRPPQEPFDELAFPRQRAHQTARRRRRRRTEGMSWESTIRPNGIIQKPSTGKKPRKPQNTSSEPSRMRSRGESGNAIRHFPSTICRVCGSMPKCVCFLFLFIIPYPACFPTIGDFSTASQRNLSFFLKKALGKSEKHAY